MNSVKSSKVAIGTATIKLRRSYQGMEDKLHIIETPQGTIRRINDNWTGSGNGKETFSRSNGHDGHLPRFYL
jgi:hypothetical protein